MARRSLLGLDLGSGSIRALLLDPDAGRRWVASRGWRFFPAQDTSGLGFEFDLDDVWRTVSQAVGEVLTRAGASPAEVIGVAVSAHRFSDVVMDAEGRPLLAAPNRDARAAGQAFGLAAASGEEMLRETGLWPLSIHTSARLRWLRDVHPDRLERARCVLSVGDWLAWRICGVRGTDRSQAGCTGLFSLAEGRWSWSRIDALGLPREIFPQVHPAGSPVGTVSAQAAQGLGIAAGAPVALAGADTQCGLAGAGVLEPGGTAVVAGTTAPLQQVCDAARVDPSGALWSGHHVAPGRFILESNGGGVGETVSFMGRLLFPDSLQPERRFFAEAAAAAPGAGGMLSTLGADRLDPRRPGLPVGQITLAPLTIPDAHGARPALARAVVEGIAFGLRDHLERVEAASGNPAEELWLLGGLSRSDLLGEVLADAVGRAVVATEGHQDTALGAALCAGVAAGIFQDLGEAARATVRIRRRFEGGSSSRAAAARVFGDWRRLREAGADARELARTLATPWAFEAARAAGPAAPIAQRPRVLVTATFDGDSLARLRSFADVTYASFREARRLLTGPALVDAVRGSDVFVTEIDVVDARSLEQLPDLRVIAACRGDAVNVDVRACTAYGIPLLAAPGRNADAVADLTIAFMLSMLRKLPAATSFLRDPSVRAGDMGKMGQAFVELQGRELWAKTVGLVGLGAVGRAVARRLAGFGARLLVADPLVSDDDAARAGGERVPLPTLLAESDIVSLHAAVTDATRGLLGASELASMKPGAFLVNTARAALLDERALAEALASGRLAGAALDTFPVEPPGADHPLVRDPRVIHTPHVGGNTVEVASHQGAVISAGLEELLRGGRPSCLRNPEVLDGFSWTGARREPGAEERERLAAASNVAVTDLQRDEQRGAKKPGSAAG